MILFLNDSNLLKPEGNSLSGFNRFIVLIGDQEMPLYMDIHKHVDGLTADAIIDAHKKDVKVQKKHGVKYLNYWYNVKDGTVFCLCNAPNKKAAEAVHREAHGLVADEIVEVMEGK